MRRVRRRFSVVIAASALALFAVGASAQGAVTADPAVTILYVKGDAEPDQIQVDCGSGIVLVNGAPAADGHANCADLIKLEVFGFGGDDTISLTGFPKPTSDEDIFGGYGEDQTEIAAYGGDGNDDVAGDATAQLLSGGAGDDTVRGVGSAIPFMLGGPGSDTMVSSSPFAIMLAGGGDDRVQQSGLFDVALGQDGADVIVGSDALDFALGGPGNDKLAGKGGTDLLIGQAGNDSLLGGAGRDLLVGSAGRDRLHGGPGRDRKFQAGLPQHKASHVVESLFGSGDSSVTFVSHRAKRLLGRSLFP